jgi:hypothetical protein
MNVKSFASAAALATVLIGAAGAASADAIPYPNSGSYNATTYSFTAAASGDVVAYFAGSGAGFSNDLGLEINGVLTGGFGLNDHSSFIGQSLDFGHANAGDVLTFVMRNNSLTKFAYSDASLNATYDDPSWTGGHNHIYSTAYTATSPVFLGIPVGIYVGFEDLPFPGSDFNYFDESFVFTNVAAHGSVPEPTAWALMLVGLGAMGVTLRRRRASATA